MEILRLKEVLKQENKTSKWFADQMGLTPGYVSSIINNKKTPTLETLHRMAELLEVDIRDLLNPTVELKEREFVEVETGKRIKILGL